MREQVEHRREDADQHVPRHVGRCVRCKRHHKACGKPDDGKAGEGQERGRHLMIRDS